MRRINLINQKFGKLTVEWRDSLNSLNNKSHQSFWFCKCDCGGTKIISSSGLKNGKTPSCGCVSRFNSGEKHHWFGKKLSKEAREKISKRLTGRKLSLEVREKMSRSRMGRIVSKETRLKISNSNMGKKRTDETKKKMRKPHPSNRGARNNMWKGGITPKNDKLRKSRDIKRWKDEVYKRDNFTDQKTGIRGIKLNAHHIQNFAEYPELQTSLQNGITLSYESHMEFHNRYGRRNNTIEQIEEFIGRKLTTSIQVDKNSPPC